MVNAKHLATFVLGAAAGVALHKYLQTDFEALLAQNKIEPLEACTLVMLSTGQY